MVAWSQHLLDSCVRVASGTGFIVDNGIGNRIVLTAAHVVGDAPSVRAAWRTGNVVLNVLNTYPDSDVAVLSDHPTMNSLRSLPLAPAPPMAGTAIAFAGYPSGWPENTAVLQRGWVAVSSSEELWFDGSANPGNSGGPIVTHENDHLQVVGILLGRAGSVEQSLRDFSAAMKNLYARAQAFRSPILFGSTGDVIGDIARTTTAGLLNMAALIERHFRTGLTRASGVARLRRALGL